jgi:hypothetical protein
MTVVRHALQTFLSLTLLGSLPLLAGADAGATISQNKPEKIRDNLFLLEEAYNQEPGVIQHIQSFTLQPRTKSWNYTFTEEWPVPTDRHQLSLTVPASNPGEFGRSGVGDFLINYRLQTIGMGGTGRLAIAPRVSLVLPTGRYQTRAGRGGTGIQLNLPVSIELGDHFVTHLNAGLTATPKAKSQSGYSASALDTNAGAALVWLTRTWFNPLVEVVHLTTQEIGDDRTRSRSSNFIVNPGLRFAINCRSGLQIVPGISMPIQFGGGTRGSVLFYFSLEHAVWKPR